MSDEELAEQFKKYEELCLKVSAKAEKNPGDITAEEIKKSQIALSALKFMKSIALRECVSESLDGNDTKINEYIARKTKEIKAKVEKLNVEKEKLLRQIKKDSDRRLTDDNKITKLNILEKVIKENEEYLASIGKSFDDKSAIMASLITKDKSPEYLLGEVVSTFKSTVPLEINRLLRTSSKTSGGVPALTALEYIKENNTINKPLVDVTLSALGKGDLFKKLYHKKELSDSKESLEFFVKYSNNIGNNVSLLEKTNSEIGILEEEKKSYERLIPAGLKSFIRPDDKQKYMAKIDEIEKKLLSLRREQSNINAFLNNIFSKVSSVDDGKLANMFGEKDINKVKEYISQNLAKINEDAISKISSLEEEIKSIDYGLSKEHRDIDISLLIPLNYVSIKDKKESRVLEQFRRSLELLRATYEISSNKEVAKEFLTSEEKELISAHTSARVNELIFEEEYSEPKPRRF